MNRLLNNLSSRKKVSNTLSEYQEDLFVIDEETRHRLQQTLLEMYVDIINVCKKYDIVPYLIGGSCLGAIRHKGFIPWDDDLDVGMTRKDFWIFKNVFEMELGGDYIMSCPNYSDKPKARFPKVMKKGTICRELEDYSEPEMCGIPIDIFILENIPANKLVRIGKGAFCNLLEFIGGQVSLKENPNQQLKRSLKAEGSLEFFIRTCVGSICSVAPASTWFNGVDKAVQYNKQTGYIGIPTGRKHYFGEILPEDYFIPPRYVEFCGIQAPVFHEAEKYLINLYGEDYMQIPQEEKREKHLIKELKF